ncbi:hypothetical protein [Bifidobacterium crudilactis]|jgi:hypothetical protein|uniref:hypothetical protein n=1 Tax=Bifidobacterium crudilactis TaxID=327277 RepID=UPI0023567C1A|nr:hypothetical protein [Bifidobacterium crudilactis]MCI1218516.1 hypothetical protein [Bifidobacterium crudilactis]
MTRLERLCDEARRTLERGETPLTDAWRMRHDVDDKEASAIADMLAAKLSIADAVLNHHVGRAAR